ncbi:MAG: hypothetical protein K0R54_4735 [Clostridiaceae bacterium]|nr:hypothetical protein [Clostridiaceae bacterium]
MKEAIAGYITSMINSNMAELARAKNPISCRTQRVCDLEVFINDLKDLLDFVEDISEEGGPINVTINKSTDYQQACNSYREMLKTTLQFLPQGLRDLVNNLIMEREEI